MIKEHHRVMEMRRVGARWVKIDGYEQILDGFPKKKPLEEIEVGNILDRYLSLFKRRKLLKYGHLIASEDVEDFVWRMA